MAEWIVSDEKVGGIQPYSEKELIRCIDCEDCDLPEEQPYKKGYCSRCGYVTIDWFCADGKRRNS